MSAPDYLFDRVTQEIRQQMDCILALTTRLAGPLPPADARACVDGVAAAAESVRRITAASSDIRSALSDTLALNPGPVALRDLVDPAKAFPGVREAVNYGLDKVRFPAPVPVGARIRARFTLFSVFLLQF